MEKRLFLLDAYALIYRAYYAFIKNPRINSKGVNTSAMLGFVNTLEELLRKENPSHIAVAFDPKGGTFRHEAYEQYKAQRQETPEDIRRAVPIIKDIIRAYNIAIMEVEGFEADDVIGTVAKQALKQGFTTYMMTPDKDYGQLVEEGIFIYKPKYGSSECEILDVEGVKNRYEIETPEQMIDLLGLMGDSSDNIPGCPGVGEVTAKKLLKEWGSIDTLLANKDKLKGALQKNVTENEEMIRFSYFLATIRTDVPIVWDEQSVARQEPNEEELTRIFSELEFRTLMNKKSKPAPKKPAHNQASLFDFGDSDASPSAEALFATPTFDSSMAQYDKQKCNYSLLTTADQFDAFIAPHSHKMCVCIDTETTSTEAMEAELVGLSICFEAGEAAYVALYQNEELTAHVRSWLMHWTDRPDVLLVGQNIKYDMLVLSNYGIEFRCQLFDTMVAHYLLEPEQSHSMDNMAEVYLNYRTIHIDQLIGAKGKNQLSMASIAPEQVYEYACEDADITMQLYALLHTRIEDTGLHELLHTIEIPLTKVLYNIEKNGVRIDTQALRQLSASMTDRLNTMEKDIYTSAGEEFNINSPKQVGELLFERLQIDAKAKKTKTGQYQTGEEVLEKLRSRHEIVGKILDYRGLKKLLSTYIDALPELINPRTGKIHTSFNQTVTATGRLSSTRPNLQNIPIRDEEGREIRRAFIPEENSLFLSADYSQIELRIMAHLSADPNMVEAFNAGEDIHTATAAKIFKVPLAEVTKEMRRRAKTANFGIIYGISTFGLAERLSISRAEAKELIDGYFTTYPQVKAYMDATIEHAKQRGYVETLYKRRRVLNDINSANANVRGYAERNAINAPIQGTSADIIKIAMVRIQQRMQREGMRSLMLIQVHDELNFSVPIEEREQMERIVREEMEGVIQLSVPLLAEVGCGASWYDAH